MYSHLDRISLLLSVLPPDLVSSRCERCGELPAPSTAAPVEIHPSLLPILEDLSQSTFKGRHIHHTDRRNPSADAPSSFLASCALTNGEEVVKSPLMESNLGSINGMPEVSEESPEPSIDVNVVPEDDKHKLEQRIFILEGEIVNLRQNQRSLDEKRRGALNKIIIDINDLKKVLALSGHLTKENITRLHRRNTIT